MIEQSLVEQALSDILASRNAVASISLDRRIEFFSRSRNANLKIMKSLTNRKEKRDHGLLLAEQSLELLKQSSATVDTDAVIFRVFHLFRQLSVDDELLENQKAVACRAALLIANYLKSPPEKLISDMRSKAPVGVEIDEDAWTSVVGASQHQFIGMVSRLGKSTNEQRSDGSSTITSGRDSKPSNDAEKPGSEWSNLEIELGPVNQNNDGWSALGVVFRDFPLKSEVGGPDSLKMSETSLQELLQLAVRELLQRNYSNAATLAGHLFGQIGLTWSPAPTVEGRNAIHVLQAVWHLRDFNAASLSSHRLAALSAYELLQGIPEFGEVCDEFRTEALRGLSQDNSTSAEEWMISMIRLLAASNEDLKDLPIDQKRALTSEWQMRSGLTSKTMLRDLVDQAQQAFRMAQGLREIELRDSERKLAILFNAIRPFALESEIGALKSLRDILQRFMRVYTGKKDDSSRLARLLELEDSVTASLETCVGSRSAVVLQVAGPFFGSLVGSLRQSKADASESSRPEICVKLLSDRLPLAHTSPANEEIQLDFELENTGSGEAQSITLELSADSLVAEVRHHLETSMRPRERARVKLFVKPRGPMAQLDLTLITHWKSELSLRFSSSSSFVAEGERPSRWQDGDVNPYSTDAVRHRGRLFGRDQQLNALRTQLLEGQSVVVTGQKRVGKSSLVTVACAEIQSENCVTAMTRYAYLQADSARAFIRNFVDYLSFEIANQLKSFQYVPFDPEHEKVNLMAGRWMSSTRKELNGIKVVIVVDDFDELPKVLLEGNEGEELFKFIRAAAQEDWLSVVLVGSEIMPALLSRHSQHMNTFGSMSVDRIDSTDGMSQLISFPSHERLEWSQEAVLTVARYAEGNPYFAVLLCRDIWQFLRERSRSYVTERDVIECANILGRKAERRHFVHLWGDSEDGMSTESGIADLNIFVMYAIARLSGEVGSCRQVEAADWIQARIADASQLVIQERINDLIARGVVAAIDRDLVRIRIGLVNLWFLKGADENLSDRLRGLATSRGSQISATDIVTIADGFVFGEREMTELRISSWLEQFSDPVLRFAAFKMLEVLKNFGYYSLQKIESMGADFRDKIEDTALSRHIRKSMNGRTTTNVFIVSVFESDFHLARRFAVGAKIPKTSVVRSDELPVRALEVDSPLVIFFASFDGTGIEMKDVIFRTKRDLGARGIEVSAAVVVLTSLNNEVEISPEGEAMGRFVLSPIDPRCKHGDDLAMSGSGVGLDVTAMDRLKRQHQELLRGGDGGWGDFGLLLAFDGVLPTYCPSIFWKSGTYQRREWRPLFSSTVAWVGTRSPASTNHLLRIVAKGESTEIEFKETLRTPVKARDQAVEDNGSAKQSQPTKNDVELWFARAVASMLNNRTGGQVIVGVRDDKSIVGLEADFLSLGKKVMRNGDGFELALRQILENRIKGLLFGEIVTEYESIDGKIVCVVTCPAASEPCWVSLPTPSGARDAFFVRDGARSKELQGQALYEFIKDRFGNR